MIHGFVREADGVMHDIEARLGSRSPPRRPAARASGLRMRDHTPLAEVARALFVTYRQRTLVGLSLMAAQAFFYNAIFFTYALILTEFYAIPAGEVGWYILPFAAGNVLGPLLLGRLFDTIGRKMMITSTYAVSGVLLAGTGFLFSHEPPFRDGIDGGLDGRLLLRFGCGKLRLPHRQRELSAGDARAGHRFFLRYRHRRRRRRRPAALGISDSAPARAAASPCGYGFGALLMVFAAAVEARFGISAERKPLEEVSRPLSFVDS